MHIGFREFFSRVPFKQKGQGDKTKLSPNKSFYLKDAIEMLTIIIHVRITNISDTILVRILLSRIELSGTVVAGVSSLVTPVLIAIKLVRIGYKGAVVLESDNYVMATISSFQGM